MSTEGLFDLTEHYTEMLVRGIRLSGEDQHFFIRGRLNDLVKSLNFTPRRILDFGCGLGHTSAEFARLFPDADILGVDTSYAAIEYARAKFASSWVSFEPLDSFSPDGSFDLCYCNGVFHHIAPKERHAAMRLVHRSLIPGGVFAVFENNPLNIGTRMVMSRIPFDRDAVTLPHWEAASLLAGAGFEVQRPRFLFYFPRVLACMRRLEPSLASLPLGAQYWVMGRKH